MGQPQENAKEREDWMGAPAEKEPILPKNLRIGELLVKEGVIKESEIQQALSLQRQEAKMTGSPLGEILVQMGSLTEAELDRLLDHPELRQKIGFLALEKGLIGKDALESCIKKQQPGQLIGDVLVNQGYLTPEELKELLELQLNAPRLGELALQQSLITEKDLEIALKIQKSPRVLGEILCDLALIDPLDLQYVLNKYSKQVKLGEILLKLGYIDTEVLNEVFQEQKFSSHSIGEILLRKQLITPMQLQEALSKQSNLPFKSLEEFVYTESEKRVLASIISQKYAEKNLMVPISLKGRELTLALLRPESMGTARELKALYKYKISCVLISDEKFSELFEILYSKKLAGVSGFEENDVDESDEQDVDYMHIELKEDIEDSEEEIPAYAAQDIEAEEIVNYIVKYGVSHGASDIHLEQDRESVKLRYRIDGALRELKTGWLRKKLQEKSGAIVSRIKVMSNLDIAERRLPQDGVFRIHYYDKAINRKADLDFRVATCRAITGENVVIRILDSRKANVGLENLNHSLHVLEPFQRALKGSAGMILVTGPTGSGKSSTLYGALQYIYNPDIKIITAEDPIEYSFPGVMQTQVNPKININFATLLRSFLRLDPDVILVGEIRDEETAKIGFDAAQTGHLVLSTLHTNDSVSAVSRLLDLEVGRAQIGASLACVLAQRLVRRICPSCSKGYVPEKNEWYLLFDRYPTQLKFYRGMGCEACGFSGYKGRTLLSEIFVIDKEITKALVDGAGIDELWTMAIHRGMKTMLDDGISKAKDTTLAELIRVVPPHIIQMFRKGYGAGDKQMPKNDQIAFTDYYILSNPVQEKAAMNVMYQEYEEICASANEGPMQLDRRLFEDFISESFQGICGQYQCQQVGFHIKNKGGKIEFSAVPM
jgi:type IV pilus assembly protein PilB